MATKQTKIVERKLGDNDRVKDCKLSGKEIQIKGLTRKIRDTTKIRIADYFRQRREAQEVSLVIREIKGQDNVEEIFSNIENAVGYCQDYGITGENAFDIIKRSDVSGSILEIAEEEVEEVKDTNKPA